MNRRNFLKALPATPLALIPGLAAAKTTTHNPASKVTFSDGSILDRGPSNTVMQITYDGKVILWNCRTCFPEDVGAIWEV